MTDQTTPEADPAPVQQGRCEGSSTSDLLAVAVESSDDGGNTWEQVSIHSTPMEAIRSAREIPWRWRLRWMSMTPGNVMCDAVVGLETERLEKLESIFDSANDQV